MEQNIPKYVTHSNYDNKPVYKTIILTPDTLCFFLNWELANLTKYSGRGGSC